MKVYILIPLFALALPLLAKGSTNDDKRYESSLIDEELMWSRQIPETFLKHKNFIIPTVCQKFDRTKDCERYLSKMGEKWVIKLSGEIPKHFSRKMLREIVGRILSSPTAVIVDIMQASLELMGFEVAGKVVGAVGYTSIGIVHGFLVGGSIGAIAGGIAGFTFWGISESPTLMKKLEWSAHNIPQQAYQ